MNEWKNILLYTQRFPVHMVFMELLKFEYIGNWKKEEEHSNIVVV